MCFVAIEFFSKAQNRNIKGYLRIPESFNPRWYLGFREYLKVIYNIPGSIQIYPLRVRMQSQDMLGKDITGYVNMEDDFNEALRLNTYYPIGPDTDNIRRQWASLDPMSTDFVAKER